jgi:hypothetical protein
LRVETTTDEYTTMPDFYSDRAAALRDKRDTKLTDDYLASAGLDENGDPVAPKISDDDGTEGIIFHVERFTSRGENTALSVVAALTGEADDATARDSRNEASDYASAAFADIASDAADTETLNRVASDTEARALAFHAEGDIERAAEEAKHTVALRTIMKRNKARETLRVRDLSSNREFTDAVLRHDLHKANAMMLAVVRDTEAPYALRLACIGAMIQIAPLVGNDDGGNFNDAWLSRTTGIPRSTCKELVDAQRAVGTDLAMLLLGTASEDRQGCREWGAMLPERQCAAVEGLKQYHTAAMIEHAGECEDVARTRKISLSEADVLDAAGMNSREGREQLVKMPVKKGQLWLAKMLDETNEAAERTGGVVATAKGAADPEKGKLVKPLSPAVPTRRLLTMEYLTSERNR